MNGSGRFGSATDFTFGAQAGYNYQINQVLVGAEFDLDRWGLNHSSSSLAGTPAAGTQHTTTSLSANYLVTLRGRLGYTFDRSLFYVTGGGAFANIKESQSNFFTGAVPTTSDYATQSGEWGWTIGGGAEYALDPHWTVKAEYLYVNFPSRTFTTNPNLSFRGRQWHCSVYA